MPGVRRAGPGPPPIQTRFRQERRVLKESTKPTTPKTKGRSDSGFGAVTIDFKHGPDSRDRLRRLYSLLLQHANERQFARGEGRPEYEPADDGAGEE